MSAIPEHLDGAVELAKVLIDLDVPYSIIITALHRVSDEAGVANDLTLGKMFAEIERGTGIDLARSWVIWKQITDTRAKAG